MSQSQPLTIDKSKWTDGPWKREPDEERFEHDGFPCLILRVSSHGALCGYVAVPPGHPWHGKSESYGDDGGVTAEVHGGITYAESCFGDVCHVPSPGEPDDVWWLGFDHAHGGDYTPAMSALGEQFKQGRHETYKDIEYVRAGVRSLAEQAKAATKP